MLPLALLGCEGPDPAKDRHPPVTTDTDLLEWPYAPPVLVGDELVRGEAAGLGVDAAPAGAEVVLHLSSAGMGAGPCLDGFATCAGILDPELWGDAVLADAYGRAAIERDVAPDETPRVVWMQAQVIDPVTGVGTWTDVIQRHVSLGPTESAVSLRDAAGQAGVAGVLTTGNSHTGGVAWLDYNGDLWPDLFVTNGAGLPHRLFRNDGDGTFTEVSWELPKPDVGLEGAAACAADVENDGDTDLLVVVDSPVQMDSEAVQAFEGGPNLLYVNGGDGTFVEDGLARGVVDPRGWRNITCAFADFDADGFVDLHLGAWAMNQPTDTPRYGRLLFNDGTGRFVDRGDLLGHGRDVLTSVAADLDADGFPELYLGHVNTIGGFVGTNPLADDLLYRNDGGELADATPSSPGIGDDAWAAMGLDVADVDNDGDLDLYETDRWDTEDPLPRGNPLYLNQGDGTFADNACDVAGICTGYSSWPTSFADFDRDGSIDLYVGSGKPWEVDLVYVNDGDGTFTSHTVPSLEEQGPRGGSTADYDGDGAVDLALWNLYADLALLRNDPRDDHHWLEAKLVGRRSNRDAIGAVVEVLAGGVGQLRRVSGGDSAHSQQSAVLHFGLGDHAGPVDLKVTWPGGDVQHVRDVPVDRIVVVDEADGLLSEALVDASAVWSAGAEALSVTATSSYGGRTALSTSSGPLGWDPDTLRFSAVYAPVPEVAEVTVTGAWGDTFVVPVTAVP